jgi:hypothetical protein
MPKIIPITEGEAPRHAARLRGAARWANKYVMPLLQIDNDVFLVLKRLPSHLDGQYNPVERVIEISRSVARFGEMIRLVIVHELIHVEEFDANAGNVKHDAAFHARHAWVWTELCKDVRAIKQVLLT